VGMGGGAGRVGVCLLMERGRRRRQGRRLGSFELGRSELEQVALHGVEWGWMDYTPADE
jgi:hypothetical protein